MNLFEAYAVLQFTSIVIAIVIGYWRMAMQLSDVILAGTERATGWIVRRKKGL